MTKHQKKSSLVNINYLHIALLPHTMKRKMGFVVHSFFFLPLRTSLSLISLSSTSLPSLSKASLVGAKSVNWPGAPSFSSRPVSRTMSCKHRNIAVIYRIMIMIHLQECKNAKKKIIYFRMDQGRGAKRGEGGTLRGEEKRGSKGGNNRYVNKREA